MEKPIRILQIVPNMQSGGLETFLMNIYRNIDKEKVQFDFLVHYLEKKFYDNEIEKLGGKVYRFSLRNDNDILKYIYELNAFFRKHKEYKVIHCHMESIGFLVFLLAKLHGVKVRIAHSHNTDTEKNLKGFLKKIMMKPFKYISTKNYACSSEAGKYLFGKKSFKVIPNAIDIEKFKYNNETRKRIRKSLSISEDVVLLGNIGRLCKQKNQIFALKVLNKILTKNKKYKLMIIGEGSEKKELDAFIEKNNLADKVIILSPQKNIEDYYQIFDIFIFPSFFEGLGIVLIEAQVSGLKCIISKNIPEEVCVNKNIIRLDLKENLWEEEILNYDFIRCNISENMEKFNIKKISKYMEEEYSHFYKEEEINA